MCDDAEDEGAASLDDSWDLCVETVGECETLEIACLQDMSTCLKDANADTTCLDEGIACLQAGGSDDDCLSAFDICLEAQSTDDLDIAPDNGPNTTDAPDEGEADVASTDLLAIGDSMLEWNIWDNGSIPEVAAKLAGMTVTNAAIGGAQFLPEDGIPSQYIPGDYKAVIVNGGANDLGEGCVCGSCLSQVDAIVNSTAQTGAMVDLVNTLTVGATEVVLIGYFKPMPGSEFEGCEQERIALNTRYASIAAARPTVIFVDPSTVMTPTATPDFMQRIKFTPR